MIEFTICFFIKQDSRDYQERCRLEGTEDKKSATRIDP